MRDIEQITTRLVLLNSGDVLRSRYRILNQLGTGGFSRTYLTEDLNRFNERCVLKQFAPQLKGTFALEKAQELFEREAGVLYRLKHSQIPQFQQLFSHKLEDRGCLFLVQDYIEGVTYHTLLNQRLEKGECFNEAEIKQLLTQVLPILEYIHSMGIIHRDISPDNLILRNRDELPVLIDFGCIKEVEIKTQSELREAIHNLTVPLIATALGKAGYSPPEQVEQGIVYAHSDLYALAATAVVLLTGEEPQQLIDLKDNRWHWRERVTISPKLEWILSTMLSPHSSDRFGSAVEVIKTLQDISVIKITQFNKTHTANSSKLEIKPKTALVGDLLAKSWIFILFTAVLILGGYLCLKVANLKMSDLLVNIDAIGTDTQLQTRFSQGERVLISQTTTPEKELAVAAFAKRNYYHAASLLAASLKATANDPESLIYLNNARIGEAKAYSIAVSIPIGSDVNAAQEILRGVAQAQDRINHNGGINELPLKVQIINDDNDPEIAKQIARNLGQDREILGLVGHYASDITLATAPIYEAEKLVAISPISTSVKLSNSSPYIFRTVPSDYLAARSLVKYMLENLHQKKVAVFYNSKSNYSESLKSEFTTAVALGGGEVTNIFDLADANFSASDRLSQAIDNGAETIMLAANTDTLDKALQVVQVNNRRLSLLGGDDVYTPKTLQVAGSLGENMILAIPWHIRNSPNNEFALTARQLWGGEVNWRSAMAYDAVQALIAAIESSPNPTRITIQKSLSDSNFSTTGASNRVKFFPSGDRSSNIQ
ncbi:MAG: ABC transporter substrate-binding protein, partial [Chroococcidiopsis sp.]